MLLVAYRPRTSSHFFVPPFLVHFANELSGFFKPSLQFRVFLNSRCPCTFLSWSARISHLFSVVDFGGGVSLLGPSPSAGHPMVTALFEFRMLAALVPFAGPKPPEQVQFM